MLNAQTARHKERGGATGGSRTEPDVVLCAVALLRQRRLVLLPHDLGLRDAVRVTLELHRHARRVELCGRAHFHLWGNWRKKKTSVKGRIRERKSSVRALHSNGLPSRILRSHSVFVN